MMTRNSTTSHDQRRHWEERYSSGPRPWDTGLTPPEVIHFWEEEHLLPPSGLALDLGCGTATNARYLALQGLHVIGFDLSLRALQMGRERLLAHTPTLQRRVHLVQSDVRSLPIRQAGACYALDIGCFHGLEPDARCDYANRLAANLHREAYYQLFAFDRASDDDLRGLLPDEVEQLFTPIFRIIRIERGKPDHRPCRWYLLQRL